MWSEKIPPVTITIPISKVNHDQGTIMAISVPALSLRTPEPRATEATTTTIDMTRRARKHVKATGIGTVRPGTEAQTEAATPQIRTHSRILATDQGAVVPTRDIILQRADPLTTGDINIQTILCRKETTPKGLLPRSTNAGIDRMMMTTAIVMITTNIGLTREARVNG